MSAHDVPLEDQAGEQPIWDVLAHARSLFEQLLQASLGHHNTRNTCLYGSLLLAVLLERFGRVRAVKVAGGGDGVAGLRDDAGCLQPHYWVEFACERGKRWVADITADQFGLAAVVLLPAEVAQLRYLAGDAAETARQVASFWREIDGHAAATRG